MQKENQRNQCKISVHQRFKKQPATPSVFSPKTPYFLHFIESNKGFSPNLNLKTEP